MLNLLLTLEYPRPLRHHLAPHQNVRLGQLLYPRETNLNFFPQPNNIAKLTLSQVVFETNIEITRQVLMVNNH